MPRQNVPQHVIVHCSASAFGDAAMIDVWHRQRGFSRIGYHFVILNGRRTARQRPGALYAVDDGRVEVGRDEGEEGAHCIGFNLSSIGICLVGNGAYTVNQMTTLRALVQRLQRTYSIPTSRVLGHCETDSGRREGKTCPILDMEAFRASLNSEPNGVSHGR